MGEKENRGKKGKKRWKRGKRGGTREENNGIVVKKGGKYPYFGMTAIKSPPKNREKFQKLSRRGEGCFWMVTIYTPKYIIYK